jgi:hypothetical protein
VAVGFTYMTAMLIQFDLAARACPPRIAGTVFALFMALSNLSTSLATGLGGDWYESGEIRWGSTTSFNVLVGIGAGTTALCWLLWPLLRRNSAVNSPVPAAPVESNGAADSLSQTP